MVEIDGDIPIANLAEFVRCNTPISAKEKWEHVENFFDALNTYNSETDTLFYRINAIFKRIEDEIGERDVKLLYDVWDCCRTVIRYDTNNHKYLPEEWKHFVVV